MQLTNTRFSHHHFHCCSAHVHCSLVVAPTPIPAGDDDVGDVRDDVDLLNLAFAAQSMTLSVDIEQHIIHVVVSLFAGKLFEMKIWFKYWFSDFENFSRQNSPECFKNSS